MYNSYGNSPTNSADLYTSIEFIQDSADESFHLEESGHIPQQTTQTAANYTTPVSKGKKRKSRTEYFLAEEKKRLAHEVKGRPQIWDTTNAQHHNHAAVAMAWREIAGILLRTSDSCKTAWIALKESHRYRKNQLLKKSGSDGGQPIPGPSFAAGMDWEFAEDLAFLPDVSRKRKTFKSSEPRSQDPADLIVVENERSDTESPRTNYFYQTRPASKVPPKDDESVDKLAENINQLIEYQKATPVSVDENPMMHKTALANIDRMLQKLPPDVVEDTLFEITVLIYNKLKLHETQK